MMKEKITPTEEWQEAVKKHLDKLGEDEKREFAHRVIFDLALWTGYNAFEMIGILECVKMDLFESIKYSEDEEDDD
jgi:hypothetical protein